ncbi:MAG: hypothetical protein V4669_15890 [Pseudomonadota bacterium]
MPSQELTQTLDVYKYRYYPATNLYVAIGNGDLFALGAEHTGGLIVRIAAVADFAQQIAACAQAARLDPKGNAVLPAEATEVEAPEDVNEDTGSLAALYPDLDTTTDAFYPSLPCESSIGGTLPPEEVENPDVTAAQEYLSHVESEGGRLVEHLLATPRPALAALGTFTPGDCFMLTEATPAAPAGRVKVDCNDPSFLNAAMPFEGRDIIYVNGLDTGHLFDRIKDPSGPARQEWPVDSSAFLSSAGYFRTTTENYWRAHLIEHLSVPVPSPSWPYAGWQWTATDAQPLYVSKPNRYLLAAWSSNQTIEYAQHALLTQIHLAMTTGLNVFTPPAYPASQVRPFCANGCIVIGHSTGPLITSSAFGRAHAGDFGPGGKQVVASMLAHVSMDGAISGSRISSIGMALAYGIAPIPSASNVICPIADELFGTTNACNANLSFVASSILRDLIPAVSQAVWGPDVDRSPVPTVTIAGGHPRGNQAAGITQLLLPGVDDGVVTMNSACGNPNPVFPGIFAPSGLSITQLVKGFEFSDWAPRLVRGVKIWASQKNLMTVPTPGYLASACTPHLSASGMVMPVAYDWVATPRDARNRYRNHYSFIQSLSEHSYDGGASPLPSLWPSYVGGLASELRQYAPQNVTGVTPVSGINVEESRAVTDPGIYTRTLDANGTRLLKPLDMRVVQRGKKIAFRMPFNIGNCTKQGTLNFRCTRWIWKRTYHLADKWEQKQSSHYVYEFVARR